MAIAPTIKATTAPAPPPPYSLPGLDEIESTNSQIEKSGGLLYNAIKVITNEAGFALAAKVFKWINSNSIMAVSVRIVGGHNVFTRVIISAMAKSTAAVPVPPEIQHMITSVVGYALIAVEKEHDLKGGKEWLSVSKLTIDEDMRLIITHESLTMMNPQPQEAPLTRVVFNPDDVL
jgi:hypothetical protein